MPINTVAENSDGAEGMAKRATKEETASKAAHALIKLFEDGEKKANALPALITNVEKAGERKVKRIRVALKCFLPELARLLKRTIPLTLQKDPSLADLATLLEEEGFLNEKKKETDD
jgi:hypothetical protein